MKLRQHPGTNSTPTSIVAQASESVPGSDPGPGTESTICAMETNEKLEPEDNLLEFSLGPS
jgi:hypothetical protein